MPHSQGALALLGCVGGGEEATGDADSDSESEDATEDESCSSFQDESCWETPEEVPPLNTTALIYSLSKPYVFAIFVLIYSLLGLYPLDSGTGRVMLENSRIVPPMIRGCSDII